MQKQCLENWQRVRGTKRSLKEAEPKRLQGSSKTKRMKHFLEDYSYLCSLSLSRESCWTKKKGLVLIEYSELGNIWFETPFILNFSFAKVCVIILHSIQNGNTLGLCFCFKEKVEIFSYPSLSRQILIGQLISLSLFILVFLCLAEEDME